MYLYMQITRKSHDIIMYVDMDSRFDTMDKQNYYASENKILN